ncbi:TonB-dependent receptor [Mucilaginibacter sp.]|jgi:TonB-linked SusC/RagA family outer membrane protein|uniref:TonB-dependent receptor n=1 Tax=Mucilaginibacter sp. TaxID=1882438 RepID=UPI003569860A
MKLTIILLFIGLAQVSAKSYAQLITLHEKNVSIEKVLLLIESQSGYHFIYDDKLDILKTQTLNINVEKETIANVLDRCLSGIPVSYKIIQKTIALKQSEQLQTEKPVIAVQKISGTVTDDKGEPLPGASVKLKGTANGVATDINGKYSLNVPSLDGVLIFSSMGFTTKEVEIANRLVINVSLTSDAKSLNDVVVIGYGTQKRANVSGALSRMVNENLNERAISRVDQALVGQLAGVTVKQSTGMPGKPFSVQVRGTGSISAGSEPLYVIDGFPLSTTTTNASGSFTSGNPLDNINPADIESIEVLKDAAAAAIYGSRASNGVVLITTKRGKLGKPVFNFNSYVGYNAASRKLKMLNGDQWIARATEIINGNYVNTYGSKGATANDSYATRLGIVGAFNANYFQDPRWSQPGHPGLQFIDWQDQLFRKGVMQSQELSASGGTDNVKYFISGAYQNQDGFVINTGYKAYSLRANVEASLTKNLKIGVNIAPTYSIAKDPGIEGKDNTYHVALSMAPVQEDTVGVMPNIGKNGLYAWDNQRNSPVGRATYSKGQAKTYRTLGTLYGDLQIIKGLNFHTSVNYDNADNTSSTYIPYIAAGTLVSRTFDPTKSLTAGTSGTYGSYRHQTFVNENTLTYSSVLGKYHNLNVLLGQSYNVDRLDNTNLASNGGYNSNVIQTLNAANAIIGGTTSTQSTLVSYFSRVQYSFKDKYLLSASLRADGSSRFGSNHRYGVFPSLSAGWRLIEEPFFKGISKLSDLKIRASYGVNGTNNLGGDYGAIPTLGTYNYVFGTTPSSVIGQAPNKVANPDLLWERSQTYDAGIDFGFFDNRITGSFDYYNKLNTQLLLNVQVPEVTGFATYLSNAGSVRNIGQELEISTHNLVGKFQWRTSINISHNTNKVVSLANGQSQILVPSAYDISDFIIKVGQPINSIYVVKMLGTLTQADIDNHAPLFGTETVGDPKYEDINRDGAIDANDRQIVGHPNPDYIWSVTNSFKYKGFDLSVMIQGQNGGSIYSLLGRAITRTGQGAQDNAPEFYINRWQSADNPGDGRVSKAYSNFGRIVNTDWLYSSDYFRVRNITLGYDLKGLIKTGVIKNARVYITAENFFGHDKYYGGANPDALNTDLSRNTNYPSPGDYGGLPLAKSLIFGINFTF